jgi:two-component system, sensor histidine kinase LadS
LNSSRFGIAAMPFGLVLSASLLFVLALLMGQPTRADAATIELPVQGTVSDIKTQTQVMLDPAGRLTAAELIASPELFGPFDPALDRESPAIWLRLEVQAPTDATGPYVLRVSRRFFTRFDLYLQAADGSFELRSATVNQPIDARTIGRDFIFDLPISPGASSTLLLHVETMQGSLQPLELWIQDGSSFAATQANTYLVFGLIFGILLALIFHNFILYLNLRQPGHFFYVLAMSSMLLLLGIDSGMLQNYLLPEFMLGSVGRINVVLVALLVITHFMFFRVFTGAQQHSPKLTIVIAVAVILLAILALLQLFASQALFVPAANLAQLFSVAIFFLMLLGAWRAGRQGVVEGYIFLVAWGIYVVSAVGRTLLSLDFTMRNPVFEYLMYFAAVAEASILALGLAYRVRLLHERHAEALREQNRAARLANLDVLTGAYNRRFLESYLGSILADRQQGRLDRAVLILDLDNFKQANDTYGHAAGDLVLRELVKRCRQVLDEDDVLCRLGGDEFVAVLREQGQRNGRNVAEDIIRAFNESPIRYEEDIMPVTVSIGVVAGFSAALSVSDVLRMADRALYQAKQAGRNQAVVFDPDRTTPFRHGPSMEAPRENRA